MYINLNEDNVELIKYGILRQMCKDYYDSLNPVDKSKYVGHEKLYATMVYRKKREKKRIEDYVSSSTFEMMFNIDGVKILEKVKLMYENGEKLVL